MNLARVIHQSVFRIRDKDQDSKKAVEPQNLSDTKGLGHSWVKPFVSVSQVEFVQNVLNENLKVNAQVGILNVMS